ncbi:hypothetical protein HPB50_000187 [Hyalomma asiaticum]|uniref:Uncharacterized protein n=1 Tax=Hyalomma asiaticum TaxID=266040 RepID=A0ACB7S5V6_HYAAI|nr:hypothetical protein HPB50_000187 [Hyalomma asiaticum]
MDRISGLHFLVDTAAEVSVLPASKEDCSSKQRKPMLRAANSTVWPAVSHTRPRAVAQISMGLRRQSAHSRLGLPNPFRPRRHHASPLPQFGHDAPLHHWGSVAC